MDIRLHVTGVWMGGEEPFPGDAALGPSAARLGGRTSRFVHPAAFTGPDVPEPSCGFLLL